MALVNIMCALGDLYDNASRIPMYNACVVQAKGDIKVATVHVVNFDPSHCLWKQLLPSTHVGHGACRSHVTCASYNRRTDTRGPRRSAGIADSRNRYPRREFVVPGGKIRTCISQWLCRPVIFPCRSDPIDARLAKVSSGQRSVVLFPLTLTK